MNFIRKELSGRRRWRWTNELLKLGSQWMLSRLGGDKCNTIASISFFAIFGWVAIGGVGIAIIATKSSFISLVIAFIVSFVVMVGILGIWMMSVINAKKSGS